MAGDAPLLSAAELRRLLDAHRAEGAAATVLSFEPDEPGSYGASSATRRAGCRAIVEARDATPEQLAVREVNSSVYVFDADALWEGSPTSTRTTPRASSTSPTRCAIWWMTDGRSPCTVRRTPVSAKA